MINKFLLLFQFFTRIPVNKTLDYTPKSFEKSSRLLVPFGFLTGIPLYLLIYGASLIKENAYITAALILLFWIIMTGAFHLDGLTDTADGFFSGRSKNKILEIMKDSRIGSYGATALFLCLLMKYIIILKLIQNSYPEGIVLITGGGKLSLLLAGFFGKRAKEISSGNVFIVKGWKFKIPLSVIIFILTGILLGNTVRIIIGTVLLFIFVFIFLNFADRTVGGITGDSLGFSSEIGELIIGILLIWA